MTLSQFGSFFFFSSRRRHTRLQGDWSSDVCSSDLTSPTLRQRSSGWSAPRTRLRTAASRAGLASHGKIGRASCRERVEISVVAVSLKKKHAKDIAADAAKYIDAHFDCHSRFNPPHC